MAIQRKKDEEALHQSVSDFRNLADTIPQIVWVSGPEGPAYYLNKQWYAYTGMPETSSAGKQWSEALHPDDREKTFAERARTVKNGELFEIEYRLKNGETGEYRWFLGRALPIRDDFGKIIKWFGTCTDIHDKKKLENALQRSNRQFKALYDANIIGVLYCDSIGNVFGANDASLQMIGYSREELNQGNVNWAKLTPPKYKEYDDKALNQLMNTGNATPWEKEYIRKDGSQIPVIVGCTLIDQAEKTILAFVLDNTERKRLEQRKDEFISIASHELKTPLTSIKGYTQILERIILEMGDEKAKKYIEKQNTYINRLDTLISDLLDVSKIQAGKLQLQKKEFVIQELIEESIDII